jgi:hypothetical protein
MKKPLSCPLRLLIDEFFLGHLNKPRSVLLQPFDAIEIRDDLLHQRLNVVLRRHGSCSASKKRDVGDDSEDHSIRPVQTSAKSNTDQGHTYRNSHSASVNLPFAALYPAKNFSIILLMSIPSVATYFVNATETYTQAQHNIKIQTNSTHQQVPYIASPMPQTQSQSLLSLDRSKPENCPGEHQHLINFPQKTKQTNN